MVREQYQESGTKITHSFTYSHSYSWAQKKNALFDNSLAPEGTEKWFLKLAEYSSAIIS